MNLLAGGTGVKDTTEEKKEYAYGNRALNIDAGDKTGPKRLQRVLRVPALKRPHQCFSVCS